MLGEVLMFLVAALILAGVLGLAMILIDPCITLSEGLSDWLREKFSQNK